MSDSIGIALLAAGKGTRLKIDIAKPLIPICGQLMVDFVVQSVEKYLKAKSAKGAIGAIIGHQKDLVESHLSKYKNVSFAFQKEQKGTADALKTYFKQVSGAWENDYTLVICADTPLVSEEILVDLHDVLVGNPNLEAVCATFEMDNPTGYGRVINEGKGFRIVEQKDASADELKIKEVNSGLYLIKTSYIKKYLDKIDSKNASGEFYLTDLFKSDENVLAMKFSDAKAFAGVNTLVQWNEVQRDLYLKKLKELLLNGVFIHDLETTCIDWNVEIAAETHIYSNVKISGNTKIGKNSIIENNVVIANSIIEDNVHILAMSHIDQSIIKNKASVGPFARIRPDSVIGEESKIGNFVETKKVQLDKGVKVSHLSYVGDAQIGAQTNIGCGFITCNYDGANKHKTTIGSGSFIGSDVQMIAPVTIGNNSFIAAGSTITSNVPDDGFAIARQKQVTKENMAKRFLKEKS